MRSCSPAWYDNPLIKTSYTASPFWFAFLALVWTGAFSSSFVSSSDPSELSSSSEFSSSSSSSESFSWALPFWATCLPLLAWAFAGWAMVSSSESSV